MFTTQVAVVTDHDTLIGHNVSDAVHRAYGPAASFRFYRPGDRFDSDLYRGMIYTPEQRVPVRNIVDRHAVRVLAAYEVDQLEHSGMLARIARHLPRPCWSDHRLAAPAH